VEAVEDLGRRMPVGVVRAALYDGYLWGKRLRKRGVDDVLEP
jgi:hypothetical protein